MELTPKIHELKCWPGFFRDVVSRKKNFEVRRDDRNFDVDDILLLREWLPTPGYTGASARAKVTFLIDHHMGGIEPGFVVMSIELLEVTAQNADASVSRETTTAPSELIWRQEPLYGGRLLAKSVEVAGEVRRYSYASPALLRAAASERAALLLAVVERLVISNALGVFDADLMHEARALVEDCYHAPGAWMPGAFELSAALTPSISAPQSEAG